MTKSVNLYPLLFVLKLLLISTVHSQTIQTETVFSERFENPVGMEYSHEGSSLLYIVRRDGNVDVKDVNNPDAPSTNFIDLSDRVYSSGELGLLGMAFSPDYQNDDTFYLYYAYEEGGEYYSTLARYRASDGVGDPESEEKLFELYQPQDNHNGGQILFGPDGYLYIGLGDGGRRSRDLAQDTGVLNGSILRIDVSSASGYTIPEDNPFVGNPKGLDEIYAWGLRNPWRMSFDPVTGHLWVADVGQYDWESIYIIEKGKNYGWPIIEGSHCYPMGTECDKTGLEMPLFEYPWGGEYGRSITGGHVYRGKDNPSLYGKYIYGDFISRRIWALEVDHDTQEVIYSEEIATSEQNLPTFGLDGFGEIYIGGWSGGVNSRIFRFVPELTLTSLSLKQIDWDETIGLNWDVNRDTEIDRFNIYRGSEPDDLALHTTVTSGVQEFTETDIPDGSTFYAVSAVDANGTESHLSNLVSYVYSTEQISNRWSLISLPFETEGIPLSNSVAYAFDGTYRIVDQLDSGMGYWARSSENEVYQARGAGIQKATLSLKEGWNIAGGLVSELPAGAIEDPNGILSSTPKFIFNGSAYEAVEFLIPGKGYWIYAEEAGEIVLDLENIEPFQSSGKQVSEALENSGESFDRLLFSSAGNQAVLNLSSESVDPDIKNRYRIPPIAPNALLDVRTPDGFIISGREQSEIELTAERYPVEVRFESGVPKAGNQSQSYSYRLILEDGGVTEKLVLSEGENRLIYREYDSISIERFQPENGDEIVRETELLPSYPNPFNPVTNLSYRIAKQQNVELSIYDATGRRVAVVLNEEQAPGQYTVPFNASGLASGIYFVRFSAGDVLSTQKLTLIK